MRPSAEHSLAERRFNDASKDGMDHANRRHELIDGAYVAARAALIWLMLLNPGMAGLFVAGTATLGFGAEYFLMQKSSKDTEQDKRMDYIDERDQREQVDRAEKRGESQAWNNRQDAELKELSDSMHQLYGWGLGAFGTVTVLQLVGLFKKKE